MKTIEERLNERPRATTETLRLLAMRGFRIVGAARIPGGKEGLVAAINRVRGC